MTNVVVIKWSWTSIANTWSAPRWTRIVGYMQEHGFPPDETGVRAALHCIEEDDQLALATARALRDEANALLAEARRIEAKVARGT